MFCTNCGRKCPDAATFCAGCGSPLSRPTNRRAEGAPAATQQAQPRQQAQPAQQARPAQQAQPARQPAPAPSPAPEQAAPAAQPSAQGTAAVAQKKSPLVFVLIAIVIVVILSGVFGFSGDGSVGSGETEAPAAEPAEDWASKYVGSWFFEGEVTNPSSGLTFYQECLITINSDGTFYETDTVTGRWLGTDYGEIHAKGTWVYAENIIELTYTSSDAGGTPIGQPGQLKLSDDGMILYADNEMSLRRAS